ncbi:MAG: DUF4012 domain-containing protein, partial [Parcubacteria group bacterium]|nr:DUF4012 domain-containing protein [Parcubacteria group bacterium]
MSRQNITLAIFDVRPIDPATKKVDFSLLENLKPEVNLKTDSPKNLIPKEVSYSSTLPVNPVRSREGPQRASASNGVKAAPAVLKAPEGVASRPYGASKEEVMEELKATLSEKINLNSELKLFGGTLSVPNGPAKRGGRLVSSSYRNRFKPPVLGRGQRTDFEHFSEDGENLEKFREEFSKIFSGYVTGEKIAGGFKPFPPPAYLPWAPRLRSNDRSEPVLDLSPAARSLEAALSGFKPIEPGTFPPNPAALNRPKTIYGLYEIAEKKASKSIVYFALTIAAAFGLTFLSARSLDLKNNILLRSEQAYINLNSAQTSISEFNFFEAASSFALAADNFELLERDLKKAGSVFGLLDTLTLGGTSDVSGLIKTGELISSAAVDVYNALEKISGVNLISVVQGGREGDILEVLNGFKLDLIQASRNLNRANALISDLDINLIPESERKKFEELKSKLPEFSRFTEKAVGYSDVLMAMLGQSNRQRLLLLFQNTSELRPTGGFPGSYALVEFNKGVLEKFFVDDIYNPDGQLKEKIIPPKPLKAITPNWGLRDSNWFVDFRASAKKAAEFYYKDTGILLDGVVAINVDLIPEILKVTGPIEMADFGLTLNSDNFIKEVQKEVEYERTKGRDQPKQILVEFGPKLLERLSSLSREDWVKTFAVLVSGFERKDILGYFVESRLQDFALSNGFAGEIKEAQDSDFLMIAHSNIMGSKTDAVIDNFVSLSVEKEKDGSLTHTLEIKRAHNGGKLGFYNKRNNDYIRVLLPEDAEL